MDTCMFCDTQVLEEDYEDHTRWHAVHGLHRHDCAQILTFLRQSQAEPNLVPQPCTCGLDSLKSALLAELTEQP